MLVVTRNLDIAENEKPYLQKRAGCYHLTGYDRPDQTMLNDSEAHEHKSYGISVLFFWTQPLSLLVYLTSEASLRYSIADKKKLAVLLYCKIRKSLHLMASETWIPAACG